MTRMTLTVSLAAGLTAALAAVVWASADPKPAPSPRPAPAPVPLPAARGPTLLFAELVIKPGEDGSRTLRLVRVPFRDGKPAGRDEVHTADASDFGFQATYHVIADRYVVLQSATVIDLADKAVLHRFDGGWVLRVEGRKVYFYNNKVTGEQAVFCYDLATRKREKVTDLGEGRWGLRGVLSPDGTKAIVREAKNVAVLAGADLPYGLALDRVGEPRVSLGDFAASCGSTGGGLVPDAPGVWLDDDRFLTQTALGKLVVVNTADGSRAGLVDLPATAKPGGWDWFGGVGFTRLGHQQPRFTLLPDGRVVYEADELFVVDVARKTWEKSAWRPLGGGFDVEAAPDRVQTGKTHFEPVTAMLRYRGKEIGRSAGVVVSSPERPRVMTTEGHVAVIEVVERPVGKGNTAVRVWTPAGGWTTLDGWAESLVGWVR